MKMIASPTTVYEHDKRANYFDCLGFFCHIVSLSDGRSFALERRVQHKEVQSYCCSTWKAFGLEAKGATPQFQFLQASTHSYFMNRAYLATFTFNTMDICSWMLLYAYVHQSCLKAQLLLLPFTTNIISAVRSEFRIADLLTLMKLKHDVVGDF